MIRFCRSGTDVGPISTPRSPRATITASDSARISSRFSTASAFSILAITLALDPARSIRSRRSRTSAGERTNERATKSTSSSSATSRSATSFGVSDGIGSGTPGRLTPLCDLTGPPTTTVQIARPESTRPTRRRTSPSSIRMSWPGSSTSPITAGLTVRSPGWAFSSGETTTSAPLARITGSASSPIRSFGPCRSAISASGRPAAACASRTRRARSACVSGVPCEKLRRAPSIPASTRAASISGVEVAGPIVATILVRRGMTVTGRKLPAEARKRLPPEVEGVLAQLLLDPEQLVVLGDPLGPRPGRRS